MNNCPSVRCDALCFDDAQDHAYEAVTELNEGEEAEGEEGRREAATKPRKAEVTPSGSSASRERVPSPPIEQSPKDAAAHEYSHIEELEQEPDEEKLRFDGPSSFRSFVDEAFGLNGLTEQRKVRDSSQVHLQFPQVEKKGDGEEVESKRDECAINVRSFMTDSDVTDDVGLICDDAVGTGSGPESRDVLTPVSDVIIAKEIVKSLIQDAIHEASKVSESTVVQAEVHGDGDVKYSEYSAEETTKGVDGTCLEEEASDTQVRLSRDLCPFI